MMVELVSSDIIQVAAIIGGIVATSIVVFVAFHTSDFGPKKTHYHRPDSNPGHEDWSARRYREGTEQRSSYRRRTDSYDRRRDLFAARQVRAVSGASFQRKQILNVGEYRVFKIIEAELISARRGHRAFAQTSLGEILDSSNEDAFFAINAKRVDILVVDYGGWPVLAIEYQGAGHYQGTAIARDTVKVTALNNAGVGYLEIFESDGVDQIGTRLREHLARTWASRNPTASRTTG
jgi:Protein of unknown function (DUF2726)